MQPQPGDELPRHQDAALVARDVLVNDVDQRELGVLPQIRDPGPILGNLGRRALRAGLAIPEKGRHPANVAIRACEALWGVEKAGKFLRLYVSPATLWALLRHPDMPTLAALGNIARVIAVSASWARIGIPGERLPRVAAGAVFVLADEVLG